jgi:hypothetical protein
MVRSSGKAAPGGPPSSGGRGGIVVVTALLLSAGALSCDQGLEPTPAGGVPPGQGVVTGTVRYRNWPPPDSLVDLRIVLFRRFPPGSIVSEVLQGRAVVHPPLGDTALVPFFVDSLRYTMTAPSGVYEYAVVAQQFGPDVYTQWRLVGQYDLDTNLTLPSPLTVPDGDTLRGIDIPVDFLYPPPQP